MKTRKRVAIWQLPALAKRFYAVSRKRGLTGALVLKEPDAKKFRAMFLRGYFARQQWLARAFIPIGLQPAQRLDLIRRHMRSTGGAKTLAEADKMIRQKMLQIIADVKKMDGTLSKQRASLAKDTVYGPVYHGMANNLTDLGAIASRIRLRLDRSNRGGG